MQIERCPYCGSTNMGIGWQMGNAQLFPDLYAYHSTSSGSAIKQIFCRDCGSVIRSVVAHPELFPRFGEVRREELLEWLNMNGILLCNESDELPSLCSLGYGMEDIVSLIERKEAFYCKAYKKRSTFFSVRTYQLLAHCRPQKSPPEEARRVLLAMKDKELVDKEELKASLGMNKKQFDRAFDFLLEHLYITAIGGRKINPNWYGYLYCTAEVWKRGVKGLHISDYRTALWELVGQSMGEPAFMALIK